jgi:predicted esterase
MRVGSLLSPLLILSQRAGAKPPSIRMSSTWDRMVVDKAKHTITIPHDKTATGASPRSSVIVLHGLGDTAQGWADVAAMWAGAMPSVRFVLPTAPMLAVTLNGGMKMPAWYDIKSLDGNADRESCDGIAESRATIDALVAAEAALVGGAANVALVGFSQGGALALYVGLQRETEPLAAVVSMSGYLPARGSWRVAAGSKGMPVGFFHGTDDQVVRPNWADMSVEELRAQELEAVSLKTYPGMGHSAVQEEIEDVAKFVSDALGARPRARL